MAEHTSARRVHNDKSLVYPRVCISVWFKYVTNNCRCKLCSKLISCRGPGGKCAYWYFSLLFLLLRASYISLESMLCLLKPVTNFSSEIAQLPKNRGNKKTKKKKKRRTNGSTATQLLVVKVFLALPGCPHYRHTRDFSPKLVLQSWEPQVSHHCLKLRKIILKRLHFLLGKNTTVSSTCSSGIPSSKFNCSLTTYCNSRPFSFNFISSYSSAEDFSFLSDHRGKKKKSSLFCCHPFIPGFLNRA